ncbi:LppP/LprE family lipoprotein [Corynebacterium sp. NPDC060344]|uniref:LppP/LprE family lipoprotein n=1 Tax=Corynebacterium sp. NPDC060344 TaxID=3347101 RepID=UPI0036473913
MRNRIGLAAACSIALALTACGDGGVFGGSGGDDAVATETDTTTITADDGTNGGDGGDGTGNGGDGRPNPTGGTPAPGGSNGGNNGGGNGGDGGGNGGDSDGANCGVDEDAAIISESIATVEPPFADGHWELTQTNFDPCGELTYALFEQMPQGNAQFGTKILMFHDGDYLGVDSTHPQQGQIVGEGDGWFEVKYKDWEALRDSGEANVAAPKYTSNVTFTWSESEGKVATEGRFPNTGL